ncbi:MAG TPA: FG-GAP-like repeat-containing protein, partial [Cyclobacteriaceae bacterium]|nr:FG-GAP-like repeat-containing protein [Cyclobacteriaceae bacterium]
DSLLDVLIVNQIQGEMKFSFIKNLGHDSFTLAKTISSGYQFGKFNLTDINNDNKIDIVLSGRKISGIESTEAFINSGEFNFEKRQVIIQNKAFTEFLFADLNNDGQKDFVGSDASLLHFYEQAAGKFTHRKDTIIKATSLLSFDFDGNLFHDIVFSGLDANNQPTTSLLLMADNFKILNKIQVSDINGSFVTGDLNHDGFFDILVSGKNSTNALVTQVFQNNVTNFSPGKLFPSLDSASIQIADFTSDGKADIAFFGKTNNIEKSWIKTFSGDSVSLPVANAKVQDYGDYDRDGDLDLIQLRSDSIVVFNNAITAVNKGPSLVACPLGVQLYDRMFYYWTKTLDDHTSSTTVTYDLKVFKSDTTAVAPEYDLTNHERLLVSHGNVGTSNYSIQKVSAGYAFEVQSIDNSFTVKAKAASTSCSGCGNVSTQSFTMCDTTSLHLEPNASGAMWFSFKNGFLGTHDNLSYHQFESDTIFAFNPPGSSSCWAIRLFKIAASNSDTVKIVHNVWNCEGSQNLLTVDSEWQNVTWKNNLNATVSTGNQLNVVLQKPVVFKALGSNKQSCWLKETFNLNISKPDLNIGASQYQIEKGSSVQLSASGGNTYNWSPASTLNSDTVCCPIATPSITTEYTVIAKDSVGCTASTKVLVEVMESGFIPTLFTPNGDGKNDELKIFGLSSASNFRFTIYNREGNIVFDTRDVTTAVYQGWSGLANGQPQPPGTYYWRVEGNNGGETLTLNGKKSGAFLLVR